MNYKKLLKNVLLSVGTIATASNTVFAVRNLGNTNYKHFFCVHDVLWEEATFEPMDTTNFYGVNLEAFEYSSSSNTNDDVFMGSTISNLYLPFFEYDEDSLFSLFTALDCIDFQNHGQTIWLPPYYANVDLATSIQACMNELSAGNDDYITFDIRPIINKVRFYTQNQIARIRIQRRAFYDFVQNHALEDYVQYVDCNVRPANIGQNEWNDCVLPLKARANNLMAAMRGIRRNR